VSEESKANETSQLEGVFMPGRIEILLTNYGNANFLCGAYDFDDGNTKEYRKLLDNTQTLKKEILKVFENR